MPPEFPTLIEWYPAEPGPQPLVIAVGTFDGVHLGHQAILRACREMAEAGGGQAAALTFEPHPRRVLEPGSALPLLTPLAQRVALLRRHGADLVAVMRFDRTLASMEPEAFVDSVLRGRLGAKGVVVGFNFTFGRGRRGDARMLRELGERAGLPVRVVPPVRVSGQVVSSSAVRRLLEEGRAGEARELLGRPYRLEGTVVRGEGRGRTLGFPTANVATDPLQLLPADGVYVALLDGMAAVAVVGTRPTFGAGPRCLEVHVLGEPGPLYGREVAVDLLEWLRPVARFPDARALAAQIEADRRAAAEYLSASRVGPPLQQFGHL